MANVVEQGSTGNQVIDGVLGDTKWGASALTFAFPALASDFGYGGEPNTGFAAFTQVQADAVRDIFEHISSVTGLTFAEVDGVSADLRLASTSLTNTAWAYGPSAAVESGDAWFNGAGVFATPTPGTYAFLVMMHEIGHLMGLEHAHNPSGYGALPADYDSMEYSIMTYRSYVGASTNGFKNGATSFATTLMAADIVALQAMYGANYETNSGDTVYRWNSATGELSIDGVGQGRPAGNTIFMTVWDGSGNDTYDLSNYRTALTIDLNPGAFSTFSTRQLADLGSDGVHFARGNVANAFLFEGNLQSLIENAIGGSRNDQITGNSADNVLAGRAGSDTLMGGEGDDILIGGAGADILNGGSGFDTVSYAAAGRGVSVSLSGAGRSGEASGDTYSAIEAVIGTRFTDTLTGDAFANRLDGGAGRDTIVGGAGDDVISGGLGLDSLTGGEGSDTFHFASAAEGPDTIQDFESGRDVLRFEVLGLGGGLDVGQIGSSHLVMGLAATSFEGQFIFDSVSSKLWFDADGMGSGSATVIARLIGVNALTENDFLIV